MKTPGKLLAIVVALSVILGMLQPAHTNPHTQISAEDMAPMPVTAKAIVLGEVTELRDKYTKHFRMSDGTMVAATYPEAVHFLQNGKWADVDNSLSESTDATGRGVLENRNNGYTVRYARQSDSRKLVSMAVNGLEICWGLEKSNAVAIKKNTMTETATAEEDITTGLKAQSTKSAVTYTEILPGIDLEYITKPEQVKENIILKSRDAQNTVSFLYDFGGLEPRLNADNSITLLDPANRTATGLVIAPPYMVDADYAYSQQITVTVEPVGKEYRLTLSADRDWLDAKERIFPVRIDPTLQTTTLVSAIRDGYASGNDPNSYWYNTIEFLRVGDQNSSGFDCITYIRFSTMPDLKPSDQVVDARLVLIPMHRYTQNSAHTMVNTFSPKPVIQAYKVTEYWDTTTAPQLTYNNQPSAESVVLDYETVDGNDPAVNTREYQWNVTRAAKEWYQSGYNYGIKLKMAAQLPTSSWFAHFVSSDYLDTDPGDRPAMLISYRNTSGLESYYSNHAQDNGRAGTGYVNDYTGNLVFVHQDASTPGSLFPVALHHVYGNDKKVSASAYASVYPKYGNGWSLDAIQRIDASGITGYPYKYTDGDGTEHYFYHAAEDASNIYTDEDGLGLKLQVFSSVQEGLYWYYMTDRAGTILKFDRTFGNGGYLRRVVNAQGKSIQYNYTWSGAVLRLTQIVDGAGSQITLQYDAAHRLTGITDTAGRVTTYEYTNEHLTAIKYPDSTPEALVRSQYNYAGTTTYLTKVTNIDGNELRYAYNTDAPPYRVNLVSEWDPVVGDGGKFAVTYAHNRTTFTDQHNPDRQAIYQFNNWGNTESVIDSNGNTENYRYTNLVQSPRNHSIAQTSRANRPVVNLLANPSFESDLSGWTIGTYGTVTVDTTDPAIGNKAIKATNADESDSAYSMISKTDMSSLGAGTYTISVHMKTQDVANPGFTGVFGAGIELRIVGGGVTRWALSDFLKGTTDTTTDDGWRRVALTFTLNTGEVLQNIYLGIFNATGIVFIDGVQLEQGTSMNHYNLVENASFERNTGLYSTPDGWTGAGLAAGADGVAVNAGTNDTPPFDGSYAVKINGSPTTSKRIYQAIKVKGSEGDVYTINAAARADSGHKGGDSRFALCVRIDYSDTTVQYRTFPFNSAYGGEQSLSETFVIDDGNTTTTKSYTQLYVFFLYYTNVNVAYVDNIQLYKDTRQSYRYDTAGNLVSTADAARQDATASFAGNNLVKQADAVGSSYEYVYNAARQMTQAQTAEGLQYTFRYDGNGNPISGAIRNDAYTTSIVPGTVYYIRAKDSAKYLKAYNAGTSAGTLVKQRTMDRTTAQRWKVESAGDGYYRLVPQHATLMSMDVTGGSPLNSTNIQLQPTADTDRQKFKLVPNDDGTYQILTKVSADKSGLDVYNASRAEDAQILQYTYSGNSNQRFVFEPAAKVTSSTNWDSPALNAVVSIRSRLTGRYLDVYNANTGDGTPAIQYAYSGDNNQLFRLVSYSNGYYKLQPLHAQGKVLTVSGTNGYGETRIVLQPIKSVNDNDQYFRFSTTGTANSAYNIISRTDDVRTLDISQDSYDSGVDIILSSGTTDAGKEFLLEKVSESITSSAGYTANGDSLTSVTDARGNTSFYSTSPTKGTLTYAQAPGEDASTRTDYLYNPNTDALESVSKSDGTRTVTNSYLYAQDRLDKITHNGFDYRFEYDDWGNPKKVKVGVGTNLQTLVTNSYKPYNGLLDTVTYGNGHTVSYRYDEDLDYLTGIKYGGVEKFTYTYNNQGNLYKIQDAINNQTVHYEYDFIDRLTRVRNSNGLELLLSYDTKNRMDSYTSILNGSAMKTGFVYGDPVTNPAHKPGLIYGVRLDDLQILSYNYDTLGRRTGRNIAPDGYVRFISNYSYLAGSAENTTTALLESFSNTGVYHPSQKFSYTYDEKGNILTIKENDVLKLSYEYDNLSQLKRENNSYISKTVTYSYDAGGNITEKKEYAYTIQTDLSGLTPTDTIGYDYNNTLWKDKLTAYDSDVDNISYDAIGNPLSYYDGRTFTWQNGRQLASTVKSGITANYKYNDAGIRTQKTVGTVTTNYYLNGASVEAESDGTNTLRYFYDEAGDLIGFKITNSTYPSGANFYYTRNGQNDIIGIINASGSLVVSYVYDSWGKLVSTTGTLATTIGVINPYRYRGYRYDVETGLYYLQSRYYDPVTSRYINADGQLNPQEGMTGYNLFQYCGNNPVNRADPTGRAFMFLTAAIGAAVGAVVGGVVGYVKTGTVKGALIGAGVGAVAGGLIGLGAGALAGAVLAGSATASTAAVVAGAGAALSQAGNAISAGLNKISNAISNVANKSSPAVQSTSKVVSEVKNDVISLERVGSALKTDLFHSFPNMVDNYAGYATQTPLNNGATLYQLAGSWTNQIGSYVGRFEWIVQGGHVTHRIFVEGGGLNGIPIMP